MAPSPFPSGSVDLTQVMMFEVTNQNGDQDVIPSSLRPIERLQEADSVITRDLVPKKDGVEGCGIVG